MEIQAPFENENGMATGIWQDMKQMERMNKIEEWKNTWNKKRKENTGPREMPKGRQREDLMPFNPFGNQPPIPKFLEVPNKTIKGMVKMPKWKFCCQ